ncbi:MAG: cardiolipin synthase [Oscillospiraceae bacterium]|nr:cardiolipin synthase [Oscillospiraceae bacterium]
MKKLFRLLFSKVTVIALLAMRQIYIFYQIIISVRGLSPWIYVAMVLFSVFVVLFYLERDGINPSYKITWTVFMTVFPVTGALFYRLFGTQKLTAKERQRFERAERRSRESVPRNEREIRMIASMDKDLGKQAQFLRRMAGAAPYTNTDTRYYSTGAALYRDLLKDISNARKSIFMQYFIFDDGYIWNKIFRLLCEKAERGVDVRILYDGFGCVATLPDGFEDDLRSKGIKVAVFNEPKLSIHIGKYMRLNHRDHRKLTVIDSNIAYGGGLNIADEYANIIERFGVWKDTGYRIEGDAVFGETTIFLQSWESVTGERDDYSLYRPSVTLFRDGFVQPYHDMPTDRINICKNVYLSAINNANRYVYLTTPYLALDYELTEAIKLAGQSGIDVRIIVPGIPDKKYVYYVTQSYYRTLLESGVKVYEYTPGFMHAKMYVSDDSFAVVGSCNTDYRSLYLNFENCCAFYGNSLVDEVRDDILKTLEQCHQVTAEDLKKTNPVKRVAQVVLRIMSPLM